MKRSNLTERERALLAVKPGEGSHARQDARAALVRRLTPAIKADPQRAAEIAAARPAADKAAYDDIIRAIKFSDAKGSMIVNSMRNVAIRALMDAYPELARAEAGVAA